jgi:hypothetical protein
MKNLFKLFFDPSKFSLFLLILPYILFNSDILVSSYFFSFLNLFLLLFLIITFDIAIKFFLNSNKIEKIVSSGFFYIFFIFFYGLYLSLFFQEYINELFGVYLRGRLIILIIAFMLIFITILFKKVLYFKYINRFLFIFSCINLVFNYPSFDFFSSRNNVTLNNYQKIKIDKSLTKPVILLVSDEYHSPDEIFQVVGDSSVYSFSNKLVKEDWIVLNNSFSQEISTIHSLSSLFNFNISGDKKFSDLSIFDLGTGKLIKSKFYDSLNSKNVKLINFGIFNLGESKPLNDLYFFPSSFVELFLFNSVYYKLKHNTGGFKVNGFSNSYFHTDDHNNFIINSTADSLKNISNQNIFTYIHLYMPHSPFFFKDEFQSLNNNDFDSYLEYWKFTNKKLDFLLSELTKDNRYRIIFTGDHGYRADARFNPKKTFTAFYGFEEKYLISIQSVQDLGSLINACY